MTSNKRPCPIWESAPKMQDISEVGCPWCSHQAGGRFWLMQSGAALLQCRLLTDRRKANLSYWIYKHNLEYRLFDANPGLGEKPPVLDQAWVEGHRDLTPSASERMLMFLRELIRCDDAGVPADKADRNLLKAAGGCRHDDDLQELLLYAMDRGWLEGGGTLDDPFFPRPNLINLGLGARIHVEEMFGELGRSRQAFVAMWFDPSMDEVYEDGIKPAIEAAGYEAVRIDQQDFVGPVVDEIVAEIRKSRFVVADFTTSKKAGARGGVYYEAGFAQGLGIDVIHTCRKGSEQDLHFDTSHLNHLIWEDTEDLRGRLQKRIEAILGRGPLSSSNGDQEVVGSHSSLAA
ncbi:MAG: hypothetical protein OXG36_10420 [Caldilineaceae bacterium]|nr:hypothetical protein [Caldilineaceae bacterium]